MNIIIIDHSGQSRLTQAQSEVFTEVIAASLRITERKHLFSWLQGSFQSLLGHEIMVCAIRASDSETYYFDSYSSTRYFTSEHLNKATLPYNGLLSRVMTAWKNTQTPVIIAPHLDEGDYGDYIVPFAEDVNALLQTELINIVAHGMCDNDGALSSFFSFSRITTEISPSHALILELLVPHLHCAINRVMGSTESTASVMPTRVTSGITGRESEILKWVHLGKTNWEIASILSISPLTVKNHIQNILRKLDVQNRSQAAMKAVKLGLVKVFQ